MTSRHARPWLLAALAAVLSATLQATIGEATLYRAELVEPRTKLHQALVLNAPPPGGWGTLGATKANLRVGVLYLAEGLHRATGQPLHRVYWWLETLALWGFLFGLGVYLSQWLPPPLALAGVLYTAAVLPWTYLQHYFHPWDRPQLCLWLVLLWAVRARRVALLAAVLAVALLVKLDVLVVPLVYLATHLRRGDAGRTLAETAALAALAFGLHAGLDWALAAPGEEARFGLGRIPARLSFNLEGLLARGLLHGSVVMFSVPAALAVVGLRRRERFLQAGVALGALMTLAWFTFTAFAETRPQTVLLALLLPPALLTAGEVLGYRESSPSPSSRA